MNSEKKISLDANENDMKNLQRQEAIHNTDSDNYDVSDSVYDGDNENKVFVSDDPLKPGVKLSDDFGNEINDDDPFDQEDEFEDDFGIPKQKKTLDIVFDTPDFNDDLATNEDVSDNEPDDEPEQNVESDSVEPSLDASSDNVDSDDDTEQTTGSDNDDAKSDVQSENVSSETVIDKKLDDKIERSNKKPEFIVAATLASFALIILALISYFCIVKIVSASNKPTTDQQAAISLIELSANVVTKSNVIYDKLNTVTEQYIAGYINKEQCISEINSIEDSIDELISLYTSNSSDFSEVNGYNSICLYTGSYISNTSLIINAIKPQVESDMPKSEIVNGYNSLAKKRTNSYTDIVNIIQSISTDYNIDLLIDKESIRCNIPNNTKTGSK